MPTRRKAQLAHQYVEYKAVSDKLHAELLARQQHILTLVGFFEEFGEPDAPAYTGQDAAVDLMNEITGVLTTALAIRVDAGYRAPRKVIATLAAIAKKPKLALSEATEPEARGALASTYQRLDEPPGTNWLDIYEAELGHADDERIRLAAERAIARLETEAKRGRPFAHDSRYLTLRLREIFLRFNDKVTRHTEWSSRGDGDLYQKEEGQFFKFIEEVLGPLHRLVRELPRSSDTPMPELSANYIVRQAARLGPVKRPDAHLSP